MYDWSPRVPIVLVSTQNESAIYATSDSLSDDENEEDIIAMLHVVQALHEHMSTLGWAGFVLGCDYVHCDREAAHRCCIVIIFHKIQPTVKLSFDVGLQSVHIFFCLLSLNLFSLAIFLVSVYLLRFRMSRSLHFRIVHAVEGHDYFVQKKR
jgi:hypothetical protein